MRNFAIMAAVEAVVILAMLTTIAHGATLRPSVRVHHALEAVAGRPFALDCTYAARGGASAITYPDGAPIVYARPWVCAQATSFARRPTVAAATALLILTHEALHVRRWDGARDERAVECLALSEVTRTARLLGADETTVAGVLVGASEAHGRAGFPAC